MDIAEVGTGGDQAHAIDAINGLSWRSTTNSPTPTAVPTYIVSGQVFVDSNHNGVLDTGEVGYQGATVTLQGATNLTTTTDSNGNYTFTNVQGGGSFTIIVTLPSGYTGTTTTSVSIPNLNQNQTINYGIVLSSILTGTPTPTVTSTPFPTTTPTANTPSVQVFVTMANTAMVSTLLKGGIDSVLAGPIRIQVTPPADPLPITAADVARAVASIESV